ncbi:MAG: YbaN family protein [Lentimicrobiaceae bacterium]|jgi:uncharacterized membrane protein YbaN (DUF454 family)|nr:YbaN family protein [Lentimicrobiaceae bacterium]
MRWIKFFIGLVFVVLGIIGAFLPVLPTTPFFIVAAYYFGQSSEKAEKWVLNHPRFGPSVVRWRERGAIAPKAKVFSASGITCSGIIIAFTKMPDIALALAYVVLVYSLIYVLSRPSK